MVVLLEVDGIRGGTHHRRAHRFMGSGPFSVTNFRGLRSQAERAKVMLRPQERARDDSARSPAASPLRRGSR